MVFSVSVKSHKKWLFTFKEVKKIIKMKSI